MTVAMAGAGAERDLEAVRRAALRLLSRREYASLELERRLVQKGHDVETARRGIADLAERGLQSDRRFVEGFVRARVARGQGRRKILAELLARGVGEEEAGVFLDVEDWNERAASAAGKRFGHRRPSSRADWARRARFLAGRGFSSAEAVHALGEPPASDRAP